MGIPTLNGRPLQIGRKLGLLSSSIYKDRGTCHAWIITDRPRRQDGTNVLVTAMRAVVEALLGDEVPDMDSVHVASTTTK